MFVYQMVNQQLWLQCWWPFGNFNGQVGEVESILLKCQARRRLTWRFYTETNLWKLCNLETCFCFILFHLLLFLKKSLNSTFENNNSLGQDPNCQDARGNWLFLKASGLPYKLDLLRLLCDAAADVRVADRSGRTALHAAASCDEGDLVLVGCWICLGLVGPGCNIHDSDLLMTKHPELCPFFFLLGTQVKW